MWNKVIFTCFLVINCLVSIAQSVNPFDIPGRVIGRISETVPVLPADISTDSSEVLIDSFQPNLDRLTLVGDTDLLISENTTTGVVADSSILNQLISTANPFDVRQSEGKLNNAEIEKSSSVDKEKIKTPVLNVRDAARGHIVVLIFSLFSLIATAVGIGLDRSKFITMLQSVVNSNKLKVLYRDRTGTIDAQFVLLYIIFFLNVSFFLYVAIRDGFFVTYFSPKWIYLLFFCIGVYAARHFVMWLLAAVFSLGDEVEVFNYSIAIHNIVYASVLVPFIMGLSYAPDALRPYMFYAAIGLAVLIYLFRQVKGMLSAVSSRKIQVIYFFLYLCAVELAPFLVGWRLLHPIG
jgi:hypothetical protein